LQNILQVQILQLAENSFQVIVIKKVVGSWDESENEINQLKCLQTLSPNVIQLTIISPPSKTLRLHVSSPNFVKPGLL
jgi:hypothetical protein